MCIFVSLVWVLQTLIHFQYCFFDTFISVVISILKQSNYANVLLKIIAKALLLILQLCHENGRFQVLLPLLSSDLYEVIQNTLEGKLASSAPVWHKDSSAVTVVMASSGYPGVYEKGVQIKGLF